MIASRFLIATTMTLLVSVPVFAAEETPAKTEIVEPAIIVTPVVSRKLVDRVLASGSIQPEEDVYVQPLVEGMSIETLKVDTGDRVEKDQVLAVLATDTLLLQKSQLVANKAKVAAARAQLEASLDEARANANEAARQRDRAMELTKTGTVSSSQSEQLKATATAAAARVNAAEKALIANDADMKVAVAQIDNIDLQLSRTDVKAPVAGIVSARSAKIGAIASGAGQPLFTIIRDGKLELKADLAESDVLKVAPGQKAQIALIGGKKPISGTVKRVDPTVSATTRLGSVEITLDNSSEARAGMYAQAQIITAERTAAALPVTAVTTNSQDITTRVVTDGTVHIVPVTTGIQDGAYIEIASGVSVGEEVVAKAGAYVRDGDKVKPVKAPAATTN
jgi:HlyD family secretion protein